ncbi:MAG: FAD:protein FMN transferase [Sutterellaceae bacterium]|nr:FAD:protein FMN transferase [Sutterellaceae bacterium]MDD7442118.1 FAD:protein FMN transferase [Sutterellaceae bacterium]MDY2868095.1 FAD:protein FMN transferase [Mesosutterella sp.]
MISRRRLLSSLLPLAAVAWCRGGEALQPEAEAFADRTTFSMDTVVSFRVYGPTGEQAKKWIDLAQEEMNRLAGLMTVHSDASPLLDVIRNSGREVEVPQETAEDVSAALAVARDSDGAFEPTIGKVVDVWKIGFGGKSVPPKEKIEEALKYVDWKRVRVSERDGLHFIRIAPGQDIDMGGIAKGDIGTRLARYLESLGAKRALLNLGGNVVLLGAAPGGKPWRIGLQHPREERNGFFAVLEAESESVITSGAYERNIEAGGKTYGHILSPKTGYPVETDLSSVTIVDRDGAKADAWCTALFALGGKRAREVLSRRGDLNAVLMSADCTTVWMTEGIAARCVVTDPEVMERVVIPRR